MEIKILDVSRVNILHTVRQFIEVMKYDIKLSHDIILFLESDLRIVTSDTRMCNARHSCRCCIVCWTEKYARVDVTYSETFEITNQLQRLKSLQNCIMELLY